MAEFESAHSPVVDISPLHAIEARIQSTEAASYEHMSKNTSEAISKSGASFKEEAQHANQNTIGSISKDLGSYFATQKAAFDNIVSAVEGVKTETQNVTRKVEDVASHLESSVKIQSEMNLKLADMKGILERIHMGIGESTAAGAEGHKVESDAIVGGLSGILTKAIGSLAGIVGGRGLMGAIGGVGVLGAAGVAAYEAKQFATGGLNSIADSIFGKIPEKSQGAGLQNLLNPPKSGEDQGFHRGKNVRGEKQAAPSKNMAKNQQEAYEGAIKAGASPSTAKIMVASVTGESLGNPSSYNADRDKHGNYAGMRQGITQWDDTRSKAIQEKFGKMPKDMSVSEQMEARVWEMKTKYPKAWNIVSDEKLSNSERLYGDIKEYEKPANPGRDVSIRMSHFNNLNLKEPDGSRSNSESNSGSSSGVDAKKVDGSTPIDEHATLKPGFAGTPTKSEGSISGYGQGKPELNIAKGREGQFENVDPKLKEAVAAAGTHLPPGYRYEATSGYSPTHGASGSAHRSGRAMDIKIFGPNGEIKNRGNNEEDAKVYRAFARSYQGEMMARHPELAKSTRWGGNFGTSGKNSEERDLMHFDLGGNGYSPGHLGPSLQAMGAGNLDKDGKMSFADDKFTPMQGGYKGAVGDRGPQTSDNSGNSYGDQISSYGNMNGNQIGMLGNMMVVVRLPLV